MPFTLAHPAAVLPLRRWLSLPALVAGSVAPDVPYYLPLPGTAPHTHSVAALFGWNLLFGIALLAVFQLLVRPALASAPAGLRARVTLPRWEIRSWRAPAVLGGSIVAGAATHLAWDAFTQTDGAAVQAWDWLRLSVIEPHKLYNVIGYASSIGGIAVLGLAAALWYRRTPPTTDIPDGLTRSTRWTAVGAITLAAMIGISIALTDPVIRVSGYDFIRQTLVGGVQGVAIGVLIYALIWHLANHRAAESLTPDRSVTRRR